MDIDIDSLITPAQYLLSKYGDYKNHTVAASILADDGSITTALNLYHFTGGPCAEVAVLISAISNGKKGFKAIAAVGDRGRLILSPCGRCRQILFDYYPDIKAVVNDSGNNVLTSVKELLPFTYDWNNEQAS